MVAGVSGLLPFLFFCSQLRAVQSSPCSGDRDETCVVEDTLTLDVSPNGDAAIELLQKKVAGLKVPLLLPRRPGALADQPRTELSQASELHSSSNLERFIKKRHLATVTPPHPVRLSKDNITLQFWSVVPTFGPEANYITFLHEYTDSLWHSLWNFTLVCSGPNNSHPTAMRFFGKETGAPYPRVMVWQCDWPKEEAALGQYEVSIREKSGNQVGQFHTSYMPRLLAKYKTMACVPPVVYQRSDKEHPDRWGAAPNSVRTLPEWLEYNLMHGVDHFMFYTYNDTVKQVMDVYQPYLDAGVATRVHMELPDFMDRSHWTFDADDKSRFNSGWPFTDCLYRAKNHAEWLMLLDVDEFLWTPFGLHEFVDRVKKPLNASVAYGAITSGDGSPHSGPFDDTSGGVQCLYFERYNFVRPHGNSLMISSSTRENTKCGCLPKALVNTSAVNSLWPHGPTSWEKGATAIKFYEGAAVINHYRIMSSPYVLSHDEVLSAGASALQKALEGRFKMTWEALAEKLKQPKDLPSPPVRSQMVPGQDVIRVTSEEDSENVDPGRPCM